MRATSKPPTVPVKVSAKNHARLREWAKEDRRSMSDIVNDLIEQHERERFWDGVREDYERLRRNPAAWKDYQDEIALYEGASMDGLEDEEPYYSPEEEEEIRAEAARSQDRGDLGR